MLDFERGWDWEITSCKDLLQFIEILRHIFFSGQYPVFPWLAFLIVGMWIGRQDLHPGRGARRLPRHPGHRDPVQDPDRHLARLRGGLQRLSGLSERGRDRHRFPDPQRRARPVEATGFHRRGPRRTGRYDPDLGDKRDTGNRRNARRS